MKAAMKAGKEPKDSKQNGRDGTFAGLLAAVRAQGAEGAGWKGSGSSGAGGGGWQSWQKRQRQVQERPQGTSFGSLHPKVSQQYASLGSKVVPDKLPDMDNEGRPFNVKLVVVNFANVGSAYGKLFNKDKSWGIFNWEGVRRCVKELLSRNFKIIGVTFQNAEAWDGDEWYKGIPQDIQSLCDSIQEAPRISSTNQKSADDEVTIKCAYRRNCCILDNDNYKDWHQLMRDNKIREWYDFSRDRIHMRYFFDAQAGWFDTLDGNALRGASEEREEKPKKWRNRRSGPRVEQLQDGAGPGMLCVTPPEARRDPRDLQAASPPGPFAPLASSVMVPTETGFRKHKGPTITVPSSLSSSVNPNTVDLTAEPRSSRSLASSGINTLTAGWTALCTAAQQGKVQSVGRLLEAGADPNLPNCIGAHPIFYALCNWSLRMFRLLEKHGANLDRARSEKGETLKAYAERKVRQADQMKRFGASCFASASRQELLRAVGARKAAQAALTALSASSRAKRRRLGGVGSQASSTRSLKSSFAIPAHGDPYGGLKNKSSIDLTEADSDSDVPEMPVEGLDANGKADEGTEVSEAGGADNGSAEAGGLDDQDHSDIQDDQDLAALLGAALNEEETVAAEAEEYPPPDDDALGAHDSEN